MKRRLTDEEYVAIEDLKRLARRWPQSLQLFSNSGGLVVLDNDGTAPSQSKILASISGIPNDGGDMT